MPQNQYEILSETIRSRCTSKVLAPADGEIHYPEEILNQGDHQLRECIATAGWAPFHYDRNVDGVAEPWRYYVLKNGACRTLAKTISNWETLKPSSKIPRLLAGCSATVLITWLPQILSQKSNFDANKLRQVNEEHLAAAACATQNLLLLGQSLGWKTYWSSGGPLASKTTFERLNIDSSERLAAAVFVCYINAPPTSAEIIPGKNRERRSNSQAWCREIESIAV